jgi:hypothetical protein
MSAASSFKSQIQSIRENEKKMGEFARKATDRLVVFYNEKQLGNQDGQFHSPQPQTPQLKLEQR